MSTQRSPGEPEILVEKTATYVLVRAVVKTMLLTAFRMRVERAEYLRPEGGVMLVANHQSFLDIPLIASAVKRHVCFVGNGSSL